MKMYEMSKISTQNNFNDTTQFREDLMEMYRKLYYNRDIRTTLRHFWIVSGWQRYFWISVPLTHHYKKCPVMWTIIGLISNNPEIDLSLSSRNNPEMSQRSLDVPIVVKFSIYISMRSSLNWVVSFKIYISPLSTMLFPMSETFKKCLNFLMFLQGVSVISS